VKPLGAWRHGPNVELASDAWLTAQLENKDRRQIFDVQRGKDGVLDLDRIREVVTALTAAEAPFLADVQKLLAIGTGTDDAILVSTAQVSAIAFAAAVGRWRAEFLQPAGGPMFASTATAPTDPEQVELQTRAYAAWRAREVSRIEKEHQSALVVAARQRQQAAEAALRARPRQRLALFAVLGYFLAVVVAWWVFVEIGVAYDVGSATPKRVDPFYGWLIITVLGIVPAFLLRTRLPRIARGGIATFREFVPPDVPDPMREDVPAEDVPPDWAPSEHDLSQASSQIPEKLEAEPGKTSARADGAAVRAPAPRAG